MRPVRQQVMHIPGRGQFGDCHRAVLASLFELQIDEVPHFAVDGPQVERFNARVATWLAERNLSSVTFPLQGTVGSVLSGVAKSCPRGYWLLSGSSKAGVDHMVICEGSVIVHDPGHGARGLAGPCSDGFFWATFLVPIDLKRHRPVVGWARRDDRPLPWWKLLLGFGT